MNKRSLTSGSIQKTNKIQCKNEPCHGELFIESCLPCEGVSDWLLVRINKASCVKVSLGDVVSYIEWLHLVDC